MKYTIEELGFILYNNRSVNGVVKNFLPTDINPFKIIRIEKILDKVKENFSSDNRMVEVNINELNSTADDVTITPKDLENLTDLIIENIGGPGWSGMEGYPEEAIIRYSYGYHKTKYGQLMMEQLGITQEDFEEYASKGFCIELINNWYDFFSCKMEDFVIIEEDRIVIFTKKISDYLDMSIEEVNEKLVNFLNIYDFIEYDITENEFLIHFESDKRYFMNAS